MRYRLIFLRIQYFPEGTISYWTYFPVVMLLIFHFHCGYFRISIYFSCNIIDVLLKSYETSQCIKLIMFLLSHSSDIQLFGTPWTVAPQVPLSMGFPRQEYQSGLPFPSPEIKFESPAFQVASLPLSHQGSPYAIISLQDSLMAQW